MQGKTDFGTKIIMCNISTLQTGKSRGSHYRIGRYFARTSPKALPNGGYMSCSSAIGLGLTKDREQVAIMTQKIASRPKNAIFIDKNRVSALLLPAGPVSPAGPKCYQRAHCVPWVLNRWIIAFAAFWGVNGANVRARTCSSRFALWLQVS